MGKQIPNAASRAFFVIAVILLLALTYARMSTAEPPEPAAPQDVENISSLAPDVSAGSILNTTGGSTSIITLNVTSQNPRWKAFVGNVTGQLALLDASNQSIYNWQLTSIQGELYATRYDGIINWDDIACATQAQISAEQAALNQADDLVDRINATFNTQSHAAFYAGPTRISQDACYSVATNVNGTSQSQSFQEVLLSDQSNFLYATMLENNTYGFNGALFDFQMIVPEDASEGDVSSTAYYLFVELI